jgi:hypothetical protein
MVGARAGGPNWSRFISAPMKSGEKWLYRRSVILGSL